MTLTINWKNESNFDFERIDLDYSMLPNCSMTQLPSPTLSAARLGQTTMQLDCTGSDLANTGSMMATYVTTVALENDMQFWFSMKAYQMEAIHLFSKPSWYVCCGLIPNETLVPRMWMGNRSNSEPESWWVKPTPQEQVYNFGGSYPSSSTFPSNLLRIECTPISQPMSISVEVAIQTP